MKYIQPVIWSKGTFLTPQHLQAQDLYLESTLNFRLSAQEFRPWGFSTLVFDEDALATGNFRISRASGIMPDGLLFDIPDSDSSPHSRPMANFFQTNKDTLDVYVAIPTYRDRGLNVSPQKNGGTRYLSDIVLLRDENNGEIEKPVQVARKNFGFLFEGEDQRDSSVLRLARVKRTTEGTFNIDTRVVPPLLDIAASPYLIGIARRLTEILSSKSAELSAGRRQKNRSLADFTVADIPNFWLLYTVNSHLPLLLHVFETKHGHPEQLFSLMLSLAGSLTTFSPRVSPRDFPAYNHEDLSSCFTALDEKLRALLQMTVPTNLVSLPFRSVGPSIYSTALDDDKYMLNTRMYIALKARMEKNDLIRKAPRLVKICSANQIESIVRNALEGLALRHEPQPPLAIQAKLEHEYFSLDQSGPCWESTLRARSLAAHVPADFPNPEIELVIVLPTKS